MEGNEKEQAFRESWQNVFKINQEKNAQYDNICIHIENGHKNLWKNNNHIIEAMHINIHKNAAHIFNSGPKWILYFLSSFRYDFGYVTGLIITLVILPSFNLY